jgi:hypothetical protein
VNDRLFPLLLLKLTEGLFVTVAEAARFQVVVAPESTHVPPLRVRVPEPLFT